MGQFLMSTRVYMGESSMEEVKGLGVHRAYIICDPFMEKCGRAGELARLLAEAGATTEIFSKVVPDPSIEVVTMAIQGMTALKPDAVLRAYAESRGEALGEFALMVTRLEVYADKGTEEEHEFVTLDSFGEDIE